jgi:hypothetical protein
MANKRIVCEIANLLRKVMKRQYSLQWSPRHEIEYALHTALLIVDEATRHQSQQHRRESFQRAADMFAQLAETHYIEATSHIETYRRETNVGD